MCLSPIEGPRNPAPANRREESRRLHPSRPYRVLRLTRKAAPLAQVLWQVFASLTCDRLAVCHDVNIAKKTACSLSHLRYRWFVRQGVIAGMPFSHRTVSGMLQKLIVGSQAKECEHG
jgi:hypothetical protein